VVQSSMLDDILVLDLSRVLAGPYATQALADLGARVIKVESPNGDETRSWGPPYAGDQSGYFLSVNRGKESLAIDLKTQAGRELMQQLALRADVVVENFKRGDLARYGLAYEQLAEHNPSLIYASIRGYGETGPRADEPGYDAALQGLTGLMAMTGEPEGPPAKLGVAWIDVLTGVHATTAILAALHARSRSGHGANLNLSLLEVGLASLVNQAQGTLLTGDAPQRRGSAHPSIVPYQAFDTADGPLMLTVGNDEQFARAVQVLGLGELSHDARFRENRARVENRSILVPLLQERLLTQKRATWLERFKEARVGATPVLTLAEAFDDPQVKALGTVGHYDHPTAGDVPYVRSPFRHRSDVDEAPHDRADGGRPPLLGEHTEAILAGDLGLSREAIEELAEAGVIVTTSSAADTQ